MTLVAPGTATHDVSEVIHAAACDIATSSGLTAITLRRVASVSGLPPATIAQVEPSMAALAASTFEVLTRAEFERIAAVVSAIDDVRDSLTVLVESLMTSEHSLSKSIWADAWSIGRHNSFVAAAARHSMIMWQELLEGLIRHGAADGVFVVDDPELAAQCFFALIDSTTAYALVGYLSDDVRTRMVTSTLEDSLGLARGSI